MRYFGRVKYITSVFYSQKMGKTHKTHFVLHFMIYTCVCENVDLLDSENLDFIWAKFVIKKNKTNLTN